MNHANPVRGEKATPGARSQIPTMRRPPAYQTYAADDLANVAYYGLSLASRGLFDSMLRAIWVNGHVPKEPYLLARAIRGDLAEVTQALVPELLGQFIPHDEDPHSLTYPELVRQRNAQEQRREKQRIGGREGAARKYNHLRPRPAPDPQGQPMGAEMKCNEMNRNEEKRTSSLGEPPSSDGARHEDEWTRAYAKVEAELP